LFDDDNIDIQLFYNNISIYYLLILLNKVLNMNLSINKRL